MRHAALRTGLIATWLLAAGLPSAAAPPRPSPQLTPAILPPPRPSGLGQPVQAAPPPPAPQPRASSGSGGDGDACFRSLLSTEGHRIRRATSELVSDPACQVTEAVVVEALAVRAREGMGTIAFEPPVTLSCAMVAALARWLDDSLQPLARGHFGRDLSRLSVGGGHECRRRNRAAVGPTSEHATGQALDIFAFVVGEERAGGFRVVVEKPVGPAQDSFVQAVRHSACGAFSTSLGPGSDAAHANHLHVDIQQRRSASTRFCQ